mmetsp:Transcript_17350/g.12349  ORF Transcript_17350/g.12349 Transcript_17350/m.12349 type:complete len:202 (-) Transcript_17350:1294-1899(-)
MLCLNTIIMECLTIHCSIRLILLVSLHCEKGILIHHLVMTIRATMHYPVYYRRPVKHSIGNMTELMILVLKHFWIGLWCHLVVRRKHTLILLLNQFFTVFLHLFNFLIASLTLVLRVFASVRRPAFANHTTEFSSRLLLLLFLLLIVLLLSRLVLVRTRLLVLLLLCLALLIVLLLYGRRCLLLELLLMVPVCLTTHSCPH